MRTTIAVPTYRRPAELARCLAALAAQSCPADEVLAIARLSDRESLAIIERHQREWPALRQVIVEREGVVAAMNAALDAATGELFALTDDDAAPESDWLARMVVVLRENTDVAGVGGR